MPAEAWLADTHDGEPVKLTPEETGHGNTRWSEDRSQIIAASLFSGQCFGLATQFLH